MTKDYSDRYAYTKISLYSSFTHIASSKNAEQSHIQLQQSALITVQWRTFLESECPLQ